MPVLPALSPANAAAADHWSAGVSAAAEAACTVGGGGLSTHTSLRGNRHCTACFRGARHPITGSIDDQLPGAGAMVSTIIVVDGEAALMLPAASAALNAIGVTSLAERGGGWRPAQLPLVLAFTQVATSTPLYRRCSRCWLPRYR